MRCSQRVVHAVPRSERAVFHFLFIYFFFFCFVRFDRLACSAASVESTPFVTTDRQVLEDARRTGWPMEKDAVDVKERRDEKKKQNKRGDQRNVAGRENGGVNGA